MNLGPKSKYNTEKKRFSHFCPTYCNSWNELWNLKHPTVNLTKKETIFCVCSSAFKKCNLICYLTVIRPFNLYPENWYPVKSTHIFFRRAPWKKLGVILINQKKIRRAPLNDLNKSREKEEEKIAKLISKAFQSFSLGSA